MSAVVGMQANFVTGTDYPVRDYVLGLDLGQATDPSALSIIRETWAVKRADAGYQNFWREVALAPDLIKYDVVHLERFPLGMSYPSIAQQVSDRLQLLRQSTPWEGSISRVEHSPRIRLAIDYTGVGRAVGDVFSSIGLVYIPITITGGNEVRFDKQDGDWHVPKRELVALTQILVQQERLKVAQGIPDGETLRKEMINFRYKLSSHGNEQYGLDWRTAAHDDILLATTIALFTARMGSDQREQANANANAKRRLRSKVRASASASR